MKINRRSWHYRFIAIFCDQDPQSLCTYFWSFVWSIFLGALSIFSIVILAPVWIPIALIVLGFQTLFKWHNNKMYNKLNREEYDKWKNPPPKEQNFVFAYFGAVKRRVCPLIEYTWEKKGDSNGKSQ